jgi:predicted ATPase/DNA-binding SARP family transcriptional activator/ATP/maltotriose-dependent transcriptional regulator MalT
MMWTLQLFSGLSAYGQERKLTRFRTQKAASLLAYLACRPVPHPRETLIAMLWPDAELEAGRHNLNNALSFLRHRLEPPGVPPGTVILADRFTVQLNPVAATSDVVSFESLVRQAGQPGASETERLSLLLQAAELYQGPLLPGFYEEWIGPEALRLESLFAHVVGQLVPLLLQAGQPEQALGYAQRALGVDPLSEEAVRQVMQALVALGQSGQALRVYRAFALRLREELDAQPSEALTGLTRQLGQNPPGPERATGTEAGLPAAESAPVAPLPLSRSAEPEPRVAAATALSVSPGRLLGNAFLLRTNTRFFDREEESARLSEMLVSPRTRLVTLMGPGGIGKTRLALEAAACLVEKSEAGKRASPLTAVFVPLADITQADRLFEVVLRTMGVLLAGELTPLEQLVAALASQPSTLLILDNFEHLVDEGALLVQELLARIASVKLLVTSRQKLDLDGERAFHLPTLPTAEGSEAPEALLCVAAIALFVDRAQAARPDFQLTERNAFAVAQLCERLEGIPLALELAAARVAILAPAKILEQIEINRLDFLATHRRNAASRQRTLRAALDWSYDLLPPTGKAFLMQLSVFRGGWTLEAAEAVCEVKQGETPELLMLLRDSSLIGVIDTQDGVRFTMLETVRAYSREKLQESGGSDHVSKRHCDFYLALAEAGESQLTGAEQALWLARLETEHDNLLAALEWSLGKPHQTQSSPDTVSQSAQPALRLAAALGRFWDMRGYLSQGRRYLTRALEQSQTTQPTRQHAKALNAAGLLANRQSDYATAWQLHTQALAISRQLQDPEGLAWSLCHLGNVAHCQGDYPAAQSHYEQSLICFQELDDPTGIAWALHHLGDVAMDRGDNARAGTLYQQSLNLFRQLGDRQSLAACLYQLGNVALDRAENEAARDLYTQSLQLRQELGDRRGCAWSLCSLGYVAHCQGDYDTARARYEAGLAAFRELGDKRGIAWTLHNLGSVAKKQGDYARAQTLYEQSLALRRELGDQSGCAWSLYQLGNVARDQGVLEVAGVRLEESLTLFRELEDKRGITACLDILGNIATDQDDYPTARSLYEQSLTIWRELRDKQGAALSIHNLGRVERLEGDGKAARTLQEQSLSLRREVGDRHGIACSLEELACLAAEEGELARAGRLWGAADALREALGSPLPPNERERHDRAVKAARSGMSREIFASAWAEGRTMTLEQAIEYALAF